MVHVSVSIITRLVMLPAGSSPPADIARRFHGGRDGLDGTDGTRSTTTAARKAMSVLERTQLAQLLIPNVLLRQSLPRPDGVDGHDDCWDDAMETDRAYEMV